MNNPINPSGFFKLFNNVQPNLKSYAHTLLPKSNQLNFSETAVVAFECPRTAALCFDRVWSIPLDQTDCPKDIAFNMSTDAELLAAISLEILPKLKENLKGFNDLEAFSNSIIDCNDETISGRKDFLQIYTAILIGSYLSGGVEAASNKYSLIDGMTRLLSNDLTQVLGKAVFPFYASVSNCNKEYGPGNHQVIVSSLRELDIVDEQYLSWEQVLEFRKDKNIRTDYKKLIHWLDGQMISKSNQYVVDEIGYRLDKYKFAIRKHGLKTMSGILSTLIDIKSFASSFAAVAGSIAAGEPLFGWIAASGLLLGKVLLTINEAKIEFETIKESNGEIAFVAQVDNKHRKKNRARRKQLKNNTQQ